MTVLAYHRRIKERSFTLNMYIDPFSKRVRVDDLQGDSEKGIQKAEEIASVNNAEKLIVKSRREQMISLIENGFQIESIVDKYFKGSDCYFLCKYYSVERRNSSYLLKEDEILRNIRLLGKREEHLGRIKPYTMKQIEKKDAEKLAVLYQSVFQVYPTPLAEPDYIRKTIEEGTIYYAYYLNDYFVSAASAEVNSDYTNAEITDCATLTEHRKHGLMKWLIRELENELIRRGIFCAYSLSRALSFGMNGALYQLSYRYRGRLMNNCLIYNKLENMNVWVKDLSQY